jgi:hypothetical protein
MAAVTALSIAPDGFSVADLAATVHTRTGQDYTRTGQDYTTRQRPPTTCGSSAARTS